MSYQSLMHILYGFRLVNAPDDYWDDVAVSYSEKDKCCDGSDRYPVHAGWEIEEVLRAAGIKVKE